MSTESPRIAFDRRTAFKAGLAAVGLVAVGRETKTFLDGAIETPSGIFYPLYEHHDTGVNEEDIPSDLDAFFRELSMDSDTWRESPEELLTAQHLISGGMFSDESVVNIFNFPVLKKLAQNSTLIVFGDAPVPNNIIDESFDMEFNRVLMGGAVWAVGNSYLLGDWIRHKLKSTDFSWGDLRRRKFIGHSVIGATLALGAPAISLLIEIIDINGYKKVEKRNTVQRILQRLQTLMGYFIPEDHNVFFRSLVMANNLLTISEHIQKDIGRKAIIGFDVGNSHSNIEDFLQAGHDFTRFLISIYPRDFLQAVVEESGSLENFCSALALKLVPDLEPEDLEEVDVLHGRPSPYQIKIRDLPLLEILESKLAA